MALYQMVYYGPQVYKFHYDLDKFLKSRDLPIWTCMTNSRFTCTPTQHHFIWCFFFFMKLRWRYRALSSLWHLKIDLCLIRFRAIILNDSSPQKLSRGVGFLGRGWVNCPFSWVFYYGTGETYILLSIHTINQIFYLKKFTKEIISFRKLKMLNFHLWLANKLFTWSKCCHKFQDVYSSIYGYSLKWIKVVCKYASGKSPG